MWCELIVFCMVAGDVWLAMWLCPRKVWHSRVALYIRTSFPTTMFPLFVLYRCINLAFCRPTVAYEQAPGGGHVGLQWWLGRHVGALAHFSRHSRAGDASRRGCLALLARACWGIAVSAGHSWRARVRCLHEPAGALRPQQATLGALLCSCSLGGGLEVGDVMRVDRVLDGC